MITEYAICALPEDDINYWHYAIKVQRRRNGHWILNWDNLYITPEGFGSPDICAAAEHDETTALQTAEKLAPDLIVNGITVAQALARSSR